MVPKLSKAQKAQKNLNKCRNFSDNFVIFHLIILYFHFTEFHLILFHFIYFFPKNFYENLEK